MEKPEESDIKKVPAARTRHLHHHHLLLLHARTNARRAHTAPPEATIGRAPPHAARACAQVEVLPGSNFINGQNNLSNQVNEEFNKLNNDPLIMMRSEEQKVCPSDLPLPLPLIMMP